MRRKNGSILIAEAFASQFFVIRNLVADGVEGRVKASQFEIDGTRGNESMRGPKVLGAEHHRLTDRHAGRNCDAAFDLHEEQQSTFKSAEALGNRTRKAHSPYQQRHSHWDQ